jgi:hypothetical protein
MASARNSEPTKELLERERCLDAALERRRNAGVEAGRELEAIRLERLYESRGYSSFDAYLQREWNTQGRKLDRSTAYRLMDWARVEEALSPIGGELPPSEAVARELAPLLPAAPRIDGDARGGPRGWRPDDAEHLIEVWQATLAEDQPVTAKLARTKVGKKLDELEKLGIRPAPAVAERPRARVIEQIRSAPVTVELGDLYALGPHRLICGDATELRVYQRLLRSVRPGLLFTDPPYNQDYGGGMGEDPFDPIPNDDLSPEEAARLLSSALSAARVHLAEGAAAYVCALSGDGYLLTNFVNVLHHSEGGWELLDLPGPRGWGHPKLILWNKMSIGPGRPDGYRGQHEAILHLRGSSEWHGGSEQDDVEDVWNVARLPRPYVHPNAKPPELAQRAMLNSTVHGAATPVLDPFVGSGSTVIAAHLLAEARLGRVAGLRDRARRGEPRARPAVDRAPHRLRARAVGAGPGAGRRRAGLAGRAGRLAGGTAARARGHQGGTDTCTSYGEAAAPARRAVSGADGVRERRRRRTAGPKRASRAIRPIQPRFPAAPR